MEAQIPRLQTTFSVTENQQEVIKSSGILLFIPQYKPCYEARAFNSRNKVNRLMTSLPVL